MEPYTSPLQGKTSVKTGCLILPTTNRNACIRTGLRTSGYFLHLSDVQNDFRFRWQSGWEWMTMVHWKRGILDLRTLQTFANVERFEFRFAILSLKFRLGFCFRFWSHWGAKKECHIASFDFVNKQRSFLAYREKTGQIMIWKKNFANSTPPHKNIKMILRLQIM